MQERRNSSANALELCLSCTNLSIHIIHFQLLVCHKRLQATSRLHHNANDTKQSANDTRQTSDNKMEVDVTPEQRPTQADLLALCGKSKDFNFNSLSTGRSGCNLKLEVFKFIGRTFCF